MKTFKFLFIILLSLFLVSCDKDDDYKMMTLTVAAHKVKYEPPFGESNIMGYAVTDSDNRKFVIDYIHDFEDKYEEGYQYVIKVKAIEKNKGKDAIEDVFGYSYYLIEIISKEKE
jgi:hypothetical protein